MKTLFCDIETLPTDRQDVIDDIKANITAPGTYKKPESIAQWLEDNRDAEADKLVAKTALDGAFGRVLCIGMAFDDKPALVLHGDSEAETLSMFKAAICDLTQPEIQTLQVVGHNVADFDLRFLFQRYVVNQIAPPPLPFGKRYNDQVFDTMTVFAGWKDRISLDKLARALGIPGKGGISGADVWPMYQAGRVQEILDYCKHDVELTRAVYKKLTFQEA